MGSIVFSAGELPQTLGEVTGYKAGIALTLDELLNHLSTESREVVSEAVQSVARIESYVFAELSAELLFAIGNISSPTAVPSCVQLFHKYRADSQLSQTYGAVLDRFTAFLEEGSRAGVSRIDGGAFAERVGDELGTRAQSMAMELVGGAAEDMQKKPWVHFRRVEWSDEAELRDLFSSEDLSTPHGHFFDQRYIDYLERNFPRIDDLKWRKFEGLTAEYFDRQGFAVELGPGRDDDGVDIRVWDTEKSSRPPLLIIQCKRTREKVGKVVVKALWADMQAEEAGGGLIVTTSSLSPGARRVCIARGYPVGEADRSALRLWLHALRTPGTGISTVT